MGLILCRWAAALGATVIGTVSTPAKADSIHAVNRPIRDSTPESTHARFDSPLRSNAMTKTAITSTKLPPPVGPFSQAIAANGSIYVSGQVGLDPQTGKVVAGGVVAETEQVFRNLAAVL